MPSFRPLASSVDWLAPFALAARMRAETGAIEGQGWAALGGNISRGVQSGFVEKTRRRERSEDIGREEAHYGDTLEQRGFENEVELKNLDVSLSRAKLEQAAAKFQVAQQDEGEKFKLWQLTPSPETEAAYRKAAADSQAWKTAVLTTGQRAEAAGTLPKPPARRGTKTTGFG